MANPLQGCVDIELDKPRTLKFTNAGLVAIEKELGMGVMEIFDATMSVTILQAMFWQGLMHESPEGRWVRDGLTLQEALDLIELPRFFEVAGVVQNAFILAFTGPETEPKNAKRGPKTAANPVTENGTGKASPQ